MLSRGLWPNITVVRTFFLFNISLTTPAEGFDDSKGFDKVWHVNILHKFKSYGVYGRVLGLFFI